MSGTSTRRKAAYAARLARKFKSPCYKIELSADNRSVIITLFLPRSVRRRRSGSI
jgi:hypothetical protein